jgi:hypothetical protein
MEVLSNGEGFAEENERTRRKERKKRKRWNDAEG